MCMCCVSGIACHPLGEKQSSDSEAACAKAAGSHQVHHSYIIVAVRPHRLSTATPIDGSTPARPRHFSSFARSRRDAAASNNRRDAHQWKNQFYLITEEIIKVTEVFSDLVFVVFVLHIHTVHMSI